MADAPPIKEQAKDERAVFSKVFRKWGGIYTRSARTGMPEDRWYNLENLQPIGDANLHVVPGLSAALYNFAADTVYAGQYANLGGIDYFYCFAVSGKIYQYQISSSAVTTINPTTLLSGANSQLDQWANLAILFIDSSGYYSWNGTSFTKITVTGAPSGGNAIAVYQGRVWIFQGRVGFFSVASGTNGANTGYGNNASDWLTASGSSFFALTDPQIRTNVTRAISANGYLYIMAGSSINVVADVYVPTGASPPVPVFTNLNVQAIIGTDQPYSVFPYNRSLMFSNSIGAWSLDGTTATKLSDDIDGTWQYRDTSLPLSGGQLTVNNILTAGFLFKRLADPVFGSNTIVACWWDGKWWFINNGAITFVMSGFVAGVPALFGLIGNKLYQLCAQMTTPPNTAWQGPLWDLGDPVRNKEMLIAGIELQIYALGGAITLSADGPATSTPITAAGSGGVTWINNEGNTVTWENNSDQPITWFNGSYYLFAGSTPGIYQKYLGLEGTSAACNFQLSALMFDYEFGARWFP